MGWVVRGQVGPGAGRAVQAGGPGGQASWHSLIGWLRELGSPQFLFHCDWCVCSAKERKKENVIIK